MHHAATACHASAVPPHIMPQLHHRASCRCCHAAYCHAAATLMLPSHRWVSCHRSRAVAITLLPIAPQGAAMCCVITVAAAHCTTVWSCHKVPLCMVSPSHCCMSCCGCCAAVSCHGH